MTRAILALGSNLGDREAHLRAAVLALRPWLLAVSGVYQTPPWGDTEQPAYLNAAACVQDEHAGPYDWLARAREIERAGGRERDPARQFGPRTIDVDVIVVWAVDGSPVILDDPELTLPHPRAHLRAFVLRPWIDIEPHGRLPGHGWLTDLLQDDRLAAEVADVRAQPGVTLESW